MIMRDSPSCHHVVMLHLLKPAHDRRLRALGLGVTTLYVVEEHNHYSPQLESADSVSD